MTEYRSESSVEGMLQQLSTLLSADNEHPWGEVLTIGQALKVMLQCQYQCSPFAAQMLRALVVGVIGRGLLETGQPELAARAIEEALTMPTSHAGSNAMEQELADRSLLHRCYQTCLTAKKPCRSLASVHKRSCQPFGARSAAAAAALPPPTGTAALDQPQCSDSKANGNQATLQVGVAAGHQHLQDSTGATCSVATARQQQRCCHEQTQQAHQQCQQQQQHQVSSQVCTASHLQGFFQNAHCMLELSSTLQDHQQHAQTAAALAEHYATTRDNLQAGRYYGDCIAACGRAANSSWAQELLVKVIPAAVDVHLAQGDAAGARASLIQYNNLLLAAGRSACEECAVCYELFTGDTGVMLLACGHIFHRNCCNEWFGHKLFEAGQFRPECPLCRQVDLSLQPSPTALSALEDIQQYHANHDSSDSNSDSSSSSDDDIDGNSNNSSDMRDDDSSSSDSESDNMEVESENRTEMSVASSSRTAATGMAGSAANAEVAMGGVPEPL